MAQQYVKNPRKLRVLARLVGKPIVWAKTNGGMGHDVAVVAEDGEEFIVSSGAARPSGHIWTRHEDGHWSRP